MYHLVLQLSWPNSLKLDVKSRKKMLMEQHWQAMLQLHLSDQQVYCQLSCTYIRGLTLYVLLNEQEKLAIQQQGKSEGFESCDRPIVRKRPIWVKIGDVLYRVTLKFDGWPWKTIGHLSFAVSSFVQHFIAIGGFKLELQSGNTQFGSNSTIFRAVWPWNLTYDLEKQ